jgi:HlyD family secretion protein/macrolide-specific efflux system membrane fusion protein
MRKRILISVAAFLLLLAGGILLYKGLGNSPAIEVIETAEVARRDIRDTLVETGLLKPQVGALVKIGARATGTIKEMRVRVGDRVRKGELIAVIDQREIKKSIEQTQKGIEATEQKINQIRLTYPLKIEEAAQAVRELEASYRIATIKKDRAEELFSKGFIPEQERDVALLTSEEAEARLDKAKHTLARLKDEYKSELSILRAELEKQLSILKEKQVRLSYTSIFSPIDGIVSKVTGQEGETVVAGLQVANLVTVIDPTKLEMWIYIDETDIGRVKRGQKIEYYVDAFPDRKFGGVLEMIDPEPEIRDNIVYYLATMRVKAEDTRFLKPMMTTHVRIIVDERKGVLSVPNSSLRYEKGKQFVYLVRPDGKAVKRVVKTGLAGERRTEIIEGLMEGERVATKVLNLQVRRGGKPL